MTQSLPDFDKLWDYDNPTETEARFRELLPRAEAFGDVDYLIQLLTQIARTQGLQREFEAAHTTLDDVEPLLSEDTKVAQVRYWLERGRVFNSSGQREQARPLFLSAYELASSIGADFYTIDAAHMMGIIEPNEEQLAWNLKALAVAEKTDDERARNWQASLYNNIGWTYHNQGEYEQALDMFGRALLFREANPDQPELIRIARWCVARTFRSLGRIEEALAIHEALLREYQALGQESGYTYEELAECYLAQGRDSDARPFFGKAYESLSQDPWLAENEPDRLERLLMLWQSDL